MQLLCQAYSPGNKLPQQFAGADKTCKHHAQIYSAAVALADQHTDAAGLEVGAVDTGELLEVADPSVQPTR